MSGESSGFLGKAAADRPWLATALIALGMTAFCVVGVRRTESAADASLIFGFVLSALYALGAPIALAAAAPRKPALRIAFFVLTLLILAGVAAAADQPSPLSPYISAPPAVLTLSVMVFFAVLMALAPFFNGGFRFGLIAPFASVLGAAGAAGALAMEGLLDSPSSAAALAIALAAGIGVGVGVGADFSMNFAKGAAPRQASAHSGHAAVAPAVFSVLAVCAFLIVHGWEANYGAMDWPALWGGASAVLFAVTASLIAGTAGLSLSAPSEQAAVDENNRRVWFTAAWRPLRAALPVTSALAGLAIIGVFAVVALFEIGLSKPVSLFTFLAIIWASAALVFVSLRTSLLIVGLLLASAIFADYAYGLFGAAAPSLLERLSALTLTAIALGQLTVSWRNAGDVWRNARDVAQNAMSDGLRRYLLTFSAGAVALAVAAYGFDWPSGYGAAAYFVSTGALSLLFAPIMMTALSAGTAR